jgi:hypothetical protein
MEQSNEHKEGRCREDSMLLMLQLVVNYTEELCCGAGSF